jgi:hypothetical protein
MFMVVLTLACLISFCCTPIGAPVVRFLNTTTSGLPGVFVTYAIHFPSRDTDGEL